MNKTCEKIYRIVRDNDFHLKDLKYNTENYWFFSYGGFDDLHVFRLKNGEIIGILEEYANPIGVDEKVLNQAKNKNFHQFFDLFYEKNDYLPDDVEDILKTILSNEYYSLSEEAEKEKIEWIWGTYQNYQEKIINSVLREGEFSEETIEELAEEVAEKVADILEENELFPLGVTEDDVIEYFKEEIIEDLRKHLQQ